MKCVRIPATQIHVIPPPLSPLFVHIPRETDDSSRPRVLHIGTAKNKNLLRLIEALDGLDVLLVVVGALDEQHFEAAKKHGVEIENHVGLTLEQLVEQYAKARLLAFVSTYEGFGMPIIEAQAVGRPVVTSKACSMPEAAGGAAVLVDPLNVTDIRRGILQVLEDEHLATKLVELGRENARQYAPERIAMCYAELYRKVHAETSGAFGNTYRYPGQPGVGGLP